MMPIFATLPNRFRFARTSRLAPTDLATVAFLVGIDIAARMLPHAPDFTPVAATALFAASVLRVRSLSVLVPVAGMLAADALFGFYDWRVMAVVYATLALPAITACWSNRLRRPGMIVPVLLATSLTFFLLTNFAVWAFSPLYAANLTGLLKCYVAALPFLQNMVAGDLTWALLLFGSRSLVQAMRAPSQIVAA